MKPVNTSRYTIGELSEKTGLSIKELLRSGADGLLQFYLSMSVGQCVYEAKCIDLEYSDPEVEQRNELPRPPSSISRLELSRCAPVGKSSIGLFIEQAEKECHLSNEVALSINEKSLLWSPAFEVTQENVGIDMTRYLLSDQMEEWVRERCGRVVEINKMHNHDLDANHLNYLAPLEVWAEPLAEEPFRYSDSSENLDEIVSLLGSMILDPVRMADVDLSEDEILRQERKNGELFFVGELTVFTEDPNYIEWVKGNSLYDRLYVHMETKERQAKEWPWGDYQTNMLEIIKQVIVDEWQGKDPANVPSKEAIIRGLKDRYPGISDHYCPVNFSKKFNWLFMPHSSTV